VVDTDDCAPTHTPINANLPAVRLNQAFADCQSKSSTRMMRLLGMEQPVEFLEYLNTLLERYARPSITDRHNHHKILL
jgi:hypothetical protein